MWTQLHKYYDEYNAENLGILRQQFYKLKVDSHSEMKDHIEKLNSIQTKLTELKPH